MNSQQETKNAVVKEQLYLPVKGDHLPMQTQTVLFLCQYCGYDSFDVILVQLQPSERFNNEDDMISEIPHKGTKSDFAGASRGYCAADFCSERINIVEAPFMRQGAKAVEVPSGGQAKAVDGPHVGFSKTESLAPDVKKPDRGPGFDDQTADLATKLPEALCLKPRLPPLHVECTVKHSEDVCWLVRQCQLPAIIGSRESTCYSGLCAVLRRIVLKGHEKCPQRNLDALLGFKQSCFTKCAEVSPWTKFCEMDIYQDQTLNGTVPAAILELEKRLASPVVISSKLLGKKKRKDGHACPQENKTDAGEVPCTESVFQKDVTFHIADKRKVRAAKCLHKRQTPPRKKFEAGLENKSTGTTEDRENNVQGRLESPEHGRSLGSFNSTSEGSDCHLVSRVKKPDSVPPHKDDLIMTQGSSKKFGGMTQGETLRTVQQKWNAAPDARQSTLDMSSSAGPERLFAQGLHVTLVDFALFCSLHSYQQSCMEEDEVHRPPGNIPLVRRWYQRMWDVPNLRGCAERCGLKEVVISKDLLQNGLPTEARADVMMGKADHEEVKSVIRNRYSQLPSAKRRFAEILHTLQECGIRIAVEDLPCENIQLPWDAFPAGVNPSQDVSEERARHKRQQTESIVAAVKMLARPGDIIVDFCSGGGHVGIVLAHCLPDCHVILVEYNEESMKRAEARIQGTRLNNVSLCQCNLSYFTGTFDIGVSLHACGVATDLVLAKCLKSRASFVCSPCCYSTGRDSPHIKYPRSQRFLDSPLTYEDYLFVCHTAEQTSWNFETEMAKQARVCMSILDTDRAEAAREMGYRVGLYSLAPPTCSPKNNLLVGTPTVGHNGVA